VLDVVLLKFLIYLKTFRRKVLAPRIDSWIQDSIFQIQRRAYEGTGAGSWERLDEEVPVTCKKMELENLPLEPKCSCGISRLSSDIDSHTTIPESPLTDNKEGKIIRILEVVR
jgi:hypothetical protein